MIHALQVDDEMNVSVKVETQYILLYLWLLIQRIRYLPGLYEHFKLMEMEKARVSRLNLVLLIN